MANYKTQDLPDGENVDPPVSSIIMVTVDPTGTPEDQYATIQNILERVNQFVLPGSVLVSGAAYPVIDGERTTAATNDTGTVITVTRKTSGDMVDGFGVTVGWRIEDDAGVANLIATLEAVRDGADTSGKLNFNVLNAGVWYRPLTLFKEGGGRIGDAVHNPADYSEFAANGDQSFAGTAGFYPRVLNQAAAPAAGVGATQCDTGEFIIWEDSDNTETWLVYNRGGTVKGIKVENI